MQDANNFNDPELSRPEVDHVHRPTDAVAAPFTSRVSHVEASNTWPHVAPVPRQSSLRIGSDLLDRVEQKCFVSEPRINAPSLGADRENAREIGLCRSREAKSRHLVSAAAWRPASAKPTHVGTQLRCVKFHEVAVFEFVEADFDGGAQRLQFERVLTAPLLQGPKRVPHGLARVLVLAGLHDLLDKGVLLGRQADVPSRHVFRILRHLSE